MPADPSGQIADLLAAARLAERSITMIIDDVDGLRDDHRRDHEALVRVQEQLQQVRDTLSEQRRTATAHRGQNLEATSTILAAIIGAVTGAASLIWQIVNR